MMPVCCLPEVQRIMAKKERPRAIRATAARPKITKAQVRAYFDGFKRVNELVAAERRAKTPQQRFEELVQLMQWSSIFGNRERPLDEDREVWERWNKLRDACRGRER
jgi:hypothetical protein